MKRFKTDKNLYIECHKTTEDYIHLGHMKKIEDNDLETHGTICYLPHPAVSKEASETTKV